MVSRVACPPCGGRNKSSHRKRNKWFEEKFHNENPPATVCNYVGIYRLTDVKYSAGTGNWNNSHEIPFGNLTGTRTVNYEMDGVGNRTLVTDNGVETVYVPNEMDQYEYVGGEQYLYDRNGNLLWDGSKRMSYNYANRLAVVILPNGEKYCYRYDALGRRVQEEAFSHEEARYKTYFSYDNFARGPLIIGENNMVLTTPEKPESPPYWDFYEYVYVRGAANEVLARYGYCNGYGGYASYYHTNQLGSTMALTGSGGYLIASYEYDVFGQPLSTPVYGGFLFRGWDWNADTGLYNYGDVAYNPDLGRLLQGDLGGCDTFMNPYLYADVDTGTIWFDEPSEDPCDKLLADLMKKCKVAETNPKLSNTDCQICLCTFADDYVTNCASLAVQKSLKLAVATYVLRECSKEPQRTAMEHFKGVAKEALTDVAKEWLGSLLDSLLKR
jgi:RHS repeat-associated protein